MMASRVFGHGGLFMSDAATGFSVLALTQADRSNRVS